MTACCLVFLASCQQPHVGAVASSFAQASGDVEMDVKSKIARILTDKGVNTKSEIGTTMLHYAASHNRIETLNFLVSQDKIDLNSVTDTKYTPLHTAAMRCSGQAAAILLDQTDTDPDLTDVKGATAYEIAESNKCGNSDAFKR